jgi:hypothetical protein
VQAAALAGIRRLDACRLKKHRQLRPLLLSERRRFRDYEPIRRPLVVGGSASPAVRIHGHGGACQHVPIQLYSVPGVTRKKGISAFYADLGSYGMSCKGLLRNHLSSLGGRDALLLYQFAEPVGVLDGPFWIENRVELPLQRGQQLLI